MAATVILTQPVGASFILGAVSGNLSVEAGPDQGNISYQWQSGSLADGSNLADIDGATAAEYTIPTDSTVGTVYYAVKVDSDEEEVTEVLSDVVPVVVAAASIVITLQPESQHLEPTETPADLTAAATYNGVETLLYQWYSCDDASGTSPVIVEEATTGTLVVPEPVPGVPAFYFCSFSATDVQDAVVTDVAEIFLEGVITIVTQPANQVVAGGETPADMVVEATTIGVDPITYQWYECDNPAKANPVAISGAITNTMTFGTMSPGHTTYYFCRLDADDADPVDSAVASITQNGLLPAVPSRLTGAFVLNYIEQCSAETQARFSQRCAFTGITFPDTNNSLRTSQIELFMDCI